MSPAFVLDASITLAWCFPEEATAASSELLERMSHDRAAVPSLWFLEVANALVAAERRQRIKAEDAAEFLRLLDSFDLDVDDHAEFRAFGHIAGLARSHGLSVYDASYLDLARQRRLPLATLDLPLRSAADRIGIALLGL